MVSFIDAHREAYGVEPICAVLPIAPSVYYEQKARESDPSRLPPRAQRDAILRPEIAARPPSLARLTESALPDVGSNRKRACNGYPLMGSVIDSGGATLPALIAGGALSGAAGGMVENAINGQANTATGVALDAAGGAAGAMAGAVIGAAAEGAAARSLAQEAPAASEGVADGKVTGYTKHGLNQAISRDGGKGVSPKAILDAAKNPMETTGQSGGRTKYVGNDATVVTNKDGKVITAHAHNQESVRDPTKR
jgi:hypothetical protein